MNVTFERFLFIVEPHASSKEWLRQEIRKQYLLFIIFYLERENAIH